MPTITLENLEYDGFKNVLIAGRRGSGKTSVALSLAHNHPSMTTWTVITDRRSIDEWREHCDDVCDIATGLNDVAQLLPTPSRLQGVIVDMCLDSVGSTVPRSRIVNLLQSAMYGSYGCVVLVCEYLSDISPSIRHQVDVCVLTSKCNPKDVIRWMSFMPREMSSKEFGEMIKAVHRHRERYLAVYESGDKFSVLYVSSDTHGAKLPSQGKFSVCDLEHDEAEEQPEEQDDSESQVSRASTTNIVIMPPPLSTSRLPSGWE